MPSEPTTSGRWFYVREGREVGPVTTDELRRLVDSGELSPADPIVPEGGISAGELLRLSAHASHPLAETTDDAPNARSVSLGMPPPDLPGYEILREIGRGGMGVVFEARHVALGRVVAVKTLLPAGGADPASLERFAREARALARLTHPGIVQIFEVGEHQGLPYFAMEFVPGGNLARRLARQPQNPATAAHLVESLARAVHAAHSAGIVHRDLKPSNVLVASDGALKVTDFGLVKDLSEHEKQTQTGAILGTFEYMAPEQARGDQARVGPHTDVYALGVILYEALVGFTPFHGPVMAVLHAVAEKDPDPPSRLRPGVPRDLELVCLKCLEKDPARRYGSAAELADELVRFQKGEPVKVRPLGPIGRAWRWCRRNPVVAALLLLVGLTLTSGTGVASYFAFAERQERRLAERRVYASQVPLAFRLWQDGGVPQARKTLASTRPELRGWEFGYLDWLFNASHETIRAHEGGALDVCFSPDGTLLASSGLDRATFSDGAVRVWDVRTGRLVFEHRGLPGDPRRVRFSPDGKILAATAAKNQGAVVTLWDARTGEELRQLRGEGSVSGLSFSRDGKRLAAGGSEKTVKVWDVATGAEVVTLKGHKEMINCVAFSPDGKRLASGGSDQVVRVWDLATRRETLTLSKDNPDDPKSPMLTASIYDVCFSPDGARILCVSGDQTVKVWDAEKGSKVMDFTEHKGDLACGCFGPDGKFVASAGTEGLVRVWEAATGRQVFVLRGHEKEILGVTFSPDGKRIATASRDGTVKLWDAVRGQGPLTLMGEGHGDAVTALAVSADGGQIVTAGWDRTALVWDAKTRRRERLILKGHSDGLHDACFSPDGKRIATASADKTARLWDAATGAELLTLTGHAEQVAAVCFSPNSDRVATAGEDGTVRVWDARTGDALLTLVRPAQAEPFSLRGEIKDFSSVRFSPDGRRLVTAGAGVPYKPQDGPRGDWVSTGSLDRAVRVWDARTGAQLLALEGHAAEAHSACYSPDGKLIASASTDKTVRLWNAATGREVATLSGHTQPVLAVCFSPDGKRLASGSGDRTVKVWDADTGQELLTLEGHGGSVRAVSFSPDGKRLYVAGDDGTVRVWSGEPRDPGERR